MKLSQKAEFNPITITLETAEEAEIFWKVIIGIDAEDIGTATEIHVRRMKNTMSNWFSNEAQLGGREDVKR